MKKFFSLILAVVLVAAMFVPSLAVESKTTFALEDIIENYKPHTEEEIAAFKAKLVEKGALDFVIHPDEYAGIYLISKNETPYVISRKDNSIYGNKTQIMGVKKNNGFVEVTGTMFDCNYWYEDYHRDPSLSYFFCGYVEDEYYTTEKVQYLHLYFGGYSVDQTSIKFLNSMSYDERVNFMLDLYLNILDTDEALGFTWDVYCGMPNPGDVNGDGKINSIDCNAMVRYLSGRDVSIDETNADVNGDGNINSADALGLKKILIGQQG